MLGAVLLGADIAGGANQIGFGGIAELLDHGELTSANLMEKACINSAA